MKIFRGKNLLLFRINLCQYYFLRFFRASVFDFGDRWGKWKLVHATYSGLLCSRMIFASPQNQGVFIKTHLETVEARKEKWWQKSNKERERKFFIRQCIINIKGSTPLDLQNAIGLLISNIGRCENHFPFIMIV